MNLDTAKRLARAGKRLDIKCTVREAYSGRHMYGRTTSALVVGPDKMAALAADAAYRVPKEERDAFIGEMLSLVWDNLGFDKIWY